MRDELIDEP
jgi:hypothetical protein